MASAAKKSFDKTLVRVIGLLSLHEPLHGIRGRPRQHVSDILRSSLVLAVAALDAFVVDSVSEAIPALAKRGALGPTVAKWAKDDAARVVASFAEANPHQALADLCREHLGRQTFQRAEAIEGILRDVLGAGSPWGTAATGLSSTWGTAVTEDQVKAMLDDYVGRRNRIVHAGDAVPGKTATAPIQYEYVVRAGTLIVVVGEAVFQSVSVRMREVR